MKRYRDDTINAVDGTNVFCHPKSKRSAQSSARPVLELVDSLPQRPFEIAYRESLIKGRRYLPA